MRQRQSPRTKTHSTASTPTQFSPTPIASQQAQIDHLVVVYAGRLCNVLSRSGRKPFRLAGLRLYADLLALWDSLDTTLIHLLDEPRLICFADAIRQALLTFEDEYVDLAEGYSWVLDMAAILDAPLPQPPQLDPETQPGTTDPSSSSNPPHQTDATPAENCPVQAELDAYLLRLQARTDLSVILVAFRSHLIALTQRYASGLFPCYHIPGLPRTNNDLESLFGSVRHRALCTAGPYHAQQQLHNYGAWLLFETVLNEDQQLEQLRCVSIDDFRQERRRMLQHQASRTADRSFRRQPKAYLAKFEAQAASIACLE